MDINDLNKSQFLLLVLLVMIVTSATTAIVTVTLMDQSPNANIGNTINTVVERTIEKIVPGATTTIVKIVKEPTTDSSEGTQIVKAVEKATPSLVKIQQTTETGGLETIGTGFAVAEKIIITATKVLPTDKQSFTVVVGKENLQANLISRDNDNGVAFLRINSDTIKLTPIVFSQKEATVGQTNIGVAMPDGGVAEIYTGIILGKLNASATTTNEAPTAGLIRTNAVIADDIGGPILNLSGEAVGIGISRGFALSAETLKTLIDQIK